MINWLDTATKTSDAAVRVNVPSPEHLLADIRTHLAEKRGFSVATINLDHVVKLRNDPMFREAYLAHSHVTADGRPILWLSSLSGKPVELGAGSELIQPLMALAAETGTPVGFFGGMQETLDVAAAQLEADHSGLIVAARISPAMGFDPTGPEADAAIAQIREKGAKLCFIALGAPKQEVFVAYAQSQLPDVGFLSIGAGLDFIAGTQVRAPKAFRRIGMEWFWRLCQSPKRMAGRYAACFAILPSLVMIALRDRKS